MALQRANIIIAWDEQGTDDEVVTQQWWKHILAPLMHYTCESTREFGFSQLYLEGEGATSRK